MNGFIRTVREFNLDEVSQHLLVVGDLTGDCFNCREVGLDYMKVKNCPKCQNEFKFIASRSTSQINPKLLFALSRKRPDLIYIEFSDLKYHKDREKARDFLS